jgi:hypothetical protein
MNIHHAGEEQSSALCMTHHDDLPGEEQSSALCMTSHDDLPGVGFGEDACFCNFNAFLSMASGEDALDTFGTLTGIDSCAAGDYMSRIKAMSSSSPTSLSRDKSPIELSADASAVEDTTNEGQDMLGRMMVASCLCLIINLQAVCRGFIQRLKYKNVRYFQEINGTRKQENGQRKAIFFCKCCPASRFGYGSEDGTWSLDLGRPVGWKNPITMRLSTKEFEKGCRDHVKSKNGRHRFWETVERVDKMTTTGGVSTSQQDLQNLAAGGIFLEELFDKYVKYWKEYQQNGGMENIFYEEEKDGVMKKFEQARRVLRKLKLEIRPLSEKGKAPVKDKRSAALAGTPSVSAFGFPVTPSLSVFGSTTPPPLTRLLLQAYSYTSTPQHHLLWLSQQQHLQLSPVRRLARSSWRRRCKGSR